MKVRKTVLIGGVAAAGVLMVLLLFLLVRQGAGGGSSLEMDGYADRELLLPDDRYIFPSVEEQALEHSFARYIDPDAPLDEELVGDLTVDIGEALEEAFRPRVENRLEELLFD
jgi:hypothetical protein